MKYLGFNPENLVPDAKKYESLIIPSFESAIMTFNRTKDLEK